MKKEKIRLKIDAKSRNGYGFIYESFHSVCAVNFLVVLFIIKMLSDKIICKCIEYVDVKWLNFEHDGQAA